MKKIFYNLLLFFCWINNAAYSQLPGSGNALLYDGIGKRMLAPVQRIAFNNFTIEAWVNPTGVTDIYSQSTGGTEGSTGSNRYLIFPNYGSEYGDQMLQAGAGLTVGTNGICVFEHSYYYMPALLSWRGNISGWTHIAVVYTDKRPALYVNGVLVATGLPSPRANVYPSNNFGGGDYGYFEGQADELKIWNRSLTQSQIRERMCQKIVSSDPLYPNLVCYYNFDETTGDVVIDRAAGSFNGTIFNNPARVTSGAAIGNASAYNYVTTGLPAAALSFNGEDNLAVTYTGGTYSGQAGTHVYVVNEKPSTENGISGVGSNNRYFGVFNVNLAAPAYTAVYNYTGNPFVTAVNEPDISLFKRANNSALNWSNANANINAASNTLTVNGQNTEYMLGVQPCRNYFPIITAAGPVNFCQGGSVILTSSPATSYLWSNGAVTQSITVNTAGIYTVTATNSTGCTSTSAGIKITINACTIFCPASGCNSSRGYIRHIFTCYGVNNTSLWNNGYADFTNLAPTPASPGRGFGMEITPGFLPNTSDAGVYLRVWIDWNNNGQFTDPGELVWCPYYKINLMSKGWIKIPVAVAPGPKRMRVAVRADVPPVSCGNFTYGEVEDYTINIRTFRPSDPAATQEDWDQPEYTGNDFSMYPNPVTNKMIIERSGYNEANAALTPAQMQLADVNGKIVLQSKLTALVQAVDVSTVASGIYFVTIKTNSGVSTRKIIIQH